MFDKGSEVEMALSLLSAALEAQTAQPYELVVVGGAAMSVLGIPVRPTKDVDVLGFRAVSLPAGPAGSESAGQARADAVLAKHKPLPGPLLAAAAAVAEALGLDSDWLNPGPTDLLDAGLPEGFQQRLTPARFGRQLTVWFPSREDLISLKTYAAADLLGPGRHTEDLRALGASCEELLTGALWARSQDPSDAFREMLAGLLRYFGCESAAEELGRG